MPREKRPEFGRRVEEVLKEHGLSQRAQKTRTGIDHGIVGEWIDGWTPGHMDNIVKWVEGFGLDLNEWLVLAGFPPLPKSGVQVLMEGLLRLQHDYPTIRVPLPHFTGPPESLTVSHALDLLRQTEEKVLNELRSGQAELESGQQRTGHGNKTEHLDNVARMGRR